MCGRASGPQTSETGEEDWSDRLLWVQQVTPRYCSAHDTQGELKGGRNCWVVRINLLPLFHKISKSLQCQRLCTLHSNSPWKHMLCATYYVLYYVLICTVLQTHQESPRCRGTWTAWWGRATSSMWPASAWAVILRCTKRCTKECTYLGNPAPEVSWYRGNSRLQYGATRQVILPRD